MVLIKLGEEYNVWEELKLVWEELAQNIFG